MDRFRLHDLSPAKVIVIAASSDIGAHLVKHYLTKGCDVVGTYRTETSMVNDLRQVGATLYPLDISSREQLREFCDRLQASGFFWDTLISAAGVLDPIGPFFKCNFMEWENSVEANSTSQLGVLHAIHYLRNPGVLAKVIFFAGGGTNGPFDYYSAYCIGKLSLIKMTELIDSECSDIKISIIGTGWVDTKIHKQTLAAGESAGINLRRTKDFIGDSEKSGSSLDCVADCVDWCLLAPREAVGGRNFSLVHDRWRTPEFIDELISNPGSYKLRRLSWSRS